MMIQAYFSQIKQVTDEYAAADFVSETDVGFETRSGGRDISSSLYPAGPPHVYDRFAANVRDDMLRKVSLFEKNHI